MGKNGKIHYFRQAEHSDCGVTCIRIVADYFGKRIAPKQLREICDISKVGISVQDILDCTRQVGMYSVAVKLKVEDLERMPLPAILLWNQNHFVVLCKIDRKRRRYHLADPSMGHMVFDEEEFRRRWESDGEPGIAVMTAPDEGFDDVQFEPERNNRKLWQLICSTVTEHRRRFAAIILCTLAALAAETALPLIFQQTVDSGIQGRDIGLVWLLVFGQLGVFLGSYLSNVVVDILMTRLGLGMGIRMMDNYLRRLITLPVDFFDRRLSSDLIQKAEDQNRLKNFLLDTPSAALFTVLTLLVFSGLLIYYNWVIFLIFVALTALGMAWSAVFLNRRRNIDYSNFAYSSENRNNLYELVNGMVEIKTNSAEDLRVDVWRRLQEKINALAMRAAWLRVTMNSGVTLLARVRDIVITGICATLVIRGELTLGAMLTVSYLTGQLAAPFSRLISSLSGVQDAKMSYERLDEVISGPEAEPEGVPEEAKTGEPIRLRGVSFKYAGSKSPYVLRGLDVVIPAGKTTAIVGESGCGKSTLIKLLAGIYCPAMGELTAGGMRLTEGNRKEWLRHCGVVNQGGYIFSSSVLANIGLCDEKPDRARAEAAARAACLHDFIETMPMGYNTRIGSTGVELSGGQKQRLLIARALYKDPEVLLLDEATSSLDAANERLITENLRRARRGKTVIVAAHRLSTVRDADLILFMRDGRIVEQGTHTELLALRGGYWQLVNNQLEIQNAITADFINVN